MKWILCLLPIVLCPFASCYSDELPQYFQAWNRVAFKKRSAEHVKYAGFIEVRLGNKQHTYQSSIYNVSAGYQVVNNFTVWLGYQYHHTLSNKTNVTQSEHRIYQQLNYKIADVSTRTRLEERFFERRPNTLWRLRVRLGYAFSQDYLFFGCPFLDDELLIKLNTPAWTGASHFNQNRLRVGIKAQMRSENEVLFGYLNLYNRNRSGDAMYHVLFLTFTFK